MSNAKTVILHGYLRDLHPGPIKIVGDTVAEIVHAFTTQIKAFRPVPGQDRHTISVVGFDTVGSLYEKTDQEEIHIVPAFVGGGGNGGFFKIIIGAVLIAAAFVVAGPAGVLAAGSLSAGLFWAGVTFALGGLLEVISPAPTIDVNSAKDPEASKYLGSPQNTTKIGTRIPLLLGRHLAFGHILSMDIDAVDVAVGDKDGDDLPPDWPF
ncbi:tail assembly protein [Inquilinus limosus]|uniref:tail assembly protein n=1 Tax=Inquilinus limosus TaxID=171674 RepID=UPI0013772ECA|nr:tail assembly protein [Inquilinus limosus]